MQMSLRDMVENTDFETLNFIKDNVSKFYGKSSNGKTCVDISKYQKDFAAMLLQMSNEPEPENITSIQELSKLYDGLLIYSFKDDLNAYMNGKLIYGYEFNSDSETFMGINDYEFRCSKDYIEKKDEALSIVKKNISCSLQIF